MNARLLLISVLATLTGPYVPTSKVALFARLVKFPMDYFGHIIKERNVVSEVSCFQIILIGKLINM